VVPPVEDGRERVIDRGANKRLAAKGGSALAQLLSPGMNPVLFADELPVPVPRSKRGTERGQEKGKRQPRGEGKPFHAVRLRQHLASINPRKAREGDAG
jgi:hypothetical protein